MNQKQIEILTKNLLTELGENPERDGLKQTPQRVSKMYQELLAGYTVDIKSLATTFPAESQDLVTVAAIPFYSLCEHHMLPFYGKAYIAYVPNKSILGLSKFARIVDAFARRLQVQERLTKQIQQTLTELLEPKGLIVHLEAEHMCMSMRGVKKPGAITQTAAVSGLFETQPELCQRFYAMIQNR